MLLLANPDCFYWWTLPVYLFWVFRLANLFRLFLLADMHPPLFIPTVPIGWHAPTFIYSDYSYWLACPRLLFWVFLFADLHRLSILTVPIGWPVPRLSIPTVPVYIFWVFLLADLSPSICSRCSYWLTSTQLNAPPPPHMFRLFLLAGLPPPPPPPRSDCSY